MTTVRPPAIEKEEKAVESSTAVIERPTKSVVIAPPPVIVADLDAVTIRESLLAALVWANRAVSKRPALQVLAGALLTTGRDALHVAGWDYEMYASASAAAPASTGRALVPMGVLLAAVRSLPARAAVTLTVDGGALLVIGGLAQFRVPLMSLGDYPAVPKRPAALLMRGTGVVLANLLRPVVACCRDSTLPVLTAVQVENADGVVTAAATDRYRLMVATGEYVRGGAKPWAPVLIPRALAVKVRASLRSEPEVRVYSDPPPPPVAAEEGKKRVLPDRRLVWVQAGERVIANYAVEGEFPRWRSLIPADRSATIVADRDDWQVAVAQSAAMLSRFDSVKLTGEGGQPVTMRSGAANSAADVTMKDAQFTGDFKVTVGFSASMMKSCLAVLAPGAVTASILSPVRPVVFAADEDPSLRCLLMPINLTRQQ